MSPNVQGVRDQGAAITHHEAGHVVAALMTVDIQLDDQRDVTVALIDGSGAGSAKIGISGDHPVQAAFVYYAGPWAESRVRWGKPVGTLDDTDNAGTSFRDKVAKTFQFGTDGDGACYRALTSADSGVPNNEPYWSYELERAWPVIARLADELRDRLDRAEPRENPFAALGRKGPAFHASMPNDEVVELLRPLLQSCGMWRYLS